MSKQDLTRILRAARKGNKRDAALLEFLAATGLRASEVAGLTVGDVELNERSGWATVRGKGRKQRKVPIHARARRALNEYLEERDDPAGDEPLFLSQKGEAISSYAVWYTVKKYAALAEVEDVTPHTFRHTVATQLVRDPEVDLVTAATFLGHSRLDTTARYSQPSAEDLEKAANRLG
jgi:site-specific recombinase XerD